ncbi:MAG: ATP-dependent helicase HrpB [Verrucomicrobia bacterium]|nr:MAG: ATP-dependent helicase HrpB [Verrucomicrobiota bacterium]
MSALPIYELETQLVADLRTHSRLVLQAPTGSGKSTQVPQILLDSGLAGDGEIVVLQPRRLATRMLAARVAQERGVRLGEEVGYQIRLDKVCGRKTRIRFVTEGVLLRQMLSDPELRGIAVIVFDEFHERHLYGDITLARALDLQESRRPDLKLVVMSATLDAGSLQKYLAPCELLTSRGRTFPVDVEYLEKPLGDFPVWDAAAAEFERISRQTEGDVLVFMSGAYEISRTISAIRHTRAGSQCTVLPLHGELAAADQDAAVARYEQRKVIVSTNVAETSLTIDGVRVVIDAGQAKIARFDPYRGINTLLVERISRASAEQRAGRAGRTAPGRCVRLWTEREHHDRPAQELPEVKRLDLAEVVLTLKASGVEDVAKFRWLEAPEARSLERALTLLTDLGALDSAGAISPLGRRMLAFPAHPRYARMLLAAHELGCVPAVVQIAALTQGRGLLRRAEGKQMQQDRDAALGESAESDFFLHLRALRFAEQRNFNPQTCRPLGIHAPAAREAAALAEQFLRIAQDEGLDTTARETPAEALQRCVLAGFPDMVALRLDGGTLRCALVHGRKGVLARESVVGTPLLVASEVREVEMRGDVETLLSLATAIKEEWLREFFPDGFRETTDVFFDSSLRRVLAKKQTRFHDLVLRSEQSDKVPHEQAAALLAREVEAGTCPLKLWDNTVDQWILRLNQLTEWFPEYELPKLGDDERRMLVEQICHGAVSYKDIKERPVWPVVKSWLSPVQQQLLDDQAPERIELPNGRKAKIVYATGTAPHIATRIQDLYGVTGELRIAAHRIPLVIQVLAPNHRPIQITQNLATFWKDSYPKIKQELQRKYPRHEWR